MKHRIISISLAVALVLSIGLIGCGGEELPETTQYNLTISSTEGGSVTAPGEGVFTYDEGEVVDLVAVEAEQGYQFVNWTGDVGTIANVNAARTTIAMNGDYSITANFVRVYSLTISSTAGGSVTAPGEGTFPYRAGSVVSLVATADVGYHFVDWTGDVTTVANVTSAMTSITMDSSYVISANFAVDLYFWVDTGVALNGPATLLPEERNPCVTLEISTNMVVDSVRVDLPDATSVIVRLYIDVFCPEAEGTAVLRFYTCEPGMPLAGGEYIFTGLDAAGEPIPGARNTDVWVGVEPPDPPTNVRAEVVEDGILVDWDESLIVAGSFEPGAEPQLGAYQLWISILETGESVYGASGISGSSHLIPQDKADFVEGKDRGLSLNGMEDGTYYLGTCLHSVAPEGSLGKGNEYRSSDPDQVIVFTIGDGEITIE
jgi:hypothetical protein